MTSLLLHLNESDAEVIDACQSALLHAAPLLEQHGNASELAAIFRAHLADGGGRLNYKKFLTDVVKSMDSQCPLATTYLPSAISYFKSGVAELRGNAAFYAGLLCGKDSSEFNQQKRNVATNLIRLLHDPVKSVRLEAMVAINLIFG